MFVTRAAAIASIVALAVPVFGGEPALVAGPATDPVSETVPQRRAAPFAVGDLFPDLAFPSLEDGSPKRLSDFRGKKLMLHVFASW